MLALAVAGCGPRTTSARPIETSTTSVAPERVRDLDVLLLERPSGGLVRASLWLDFGTRNAEPPAAATLAAMAVERPGVSARATHDRIELSTSGTTEDLPQMLASLVRAISDRDLPDHAELRAALDDRRRGAYADPIRRADLLALRGTFGAAADPFEGQPTAAQTGAVMARFGTSHALLVVAGSMPEDVRDQIASAFADAPRGASVPGPSERQGERVQIERSGERTVMTVARTVATLGEAQALADWVDGVCDSTHLYPHGGGVTLFARARSAEHAAQLWHLAQLAPPGLERETAFDANVGTEMEIVASQWRSGPPVSTFALGGVCAEASGTTCVETLQAATRTPPAVEFSEDGDTRLGATLATGARVDVERRRGPEAAALHVVTGGIAHGDTVVVGRALASVCGEVDVRLDPHGFTLVSRGPWRAAMARVVRCLLHESPAVDALPLAHALRRHAARGWIAEALAPGATSRIAPEGTSAAVADARAPALVLPALRTGARLRLAVVGEGALPVMAGAAAAALSPFPSGGASTYAEWETAHAIVPRSWDRESVRIVVGWRTDRGLEGGALIGRAVARLAADDLGDAGQLLWHNGGGGEWGTWAALAFDLEPSAVDAFGARVRAWRPGDLAPHLEREATRERWRTADVSEAAIRLAVFGSSAPRIPDPAAATALLRDLTPPSFVIARPQHPAALRRSRRR